jgi:hypothetical protein
MNINKIWIKKNEANKRKYSNKQYQEQNKQK